MYPMLEEELARQTSIEARRTATNVRRARATREASRRAANHPVMDARDVGIREADAGDVLALMRLAELDSGELPSGRALVAVVDGRVRAALAIESGKVIANPFESTDQLVALLRLRAQQVEPVRAASSRRRGVLGLLTMRLGRAA